MKAALLAAAITAGRAESRRWLPVAFAAADANVCAQATRTDKPVFSVVLLFIAVLQAAVSMSFCDVNEKPLSSPAIPRADDRHMQHGRMCIYDSANSKAAHREQQVYSTAALGRLRAESTAPRLRARAAARRQEMEPGRRLTPAAAHRAAVAAVARRCDPQGRSRRGCRRACARAAEEEHEDHRAVFNRQSRHTLRP